jgi:hypothetical protein
MGCGASIPNKLGGKGRKRRSVIQEVAVFLPTIRVPVAIDIVHPLRGLVSKELLDRLATLRSNVVLLAEDICMLITTSVVFPDYTSLWFYLTSDG